MNQNSGGKQINPAPHDPIHHALVSEEPILPSSGFLAAVIERIEEESRAPKPIPFPWKRAFLAFPLVAAVIGWCAYELFQNGIPSSGNFSLPQLQLAAAPASPLDQVAWVALAFVISLLSWKLARRLTGLS